MEDDVAFAGEFRRQDRATHAGRRAFEEPCEKGIFQGPDPVPVALRRFDGARGICVLQRPHVLRIMERRQLIDRRRLRRVERVVRQPAEHVDEVQDG